MLLALNSEHFFTTTSGFCYFRVFVFGAGCIRGSLDAGQTREFSCRMLKSWSNRFPMAIIREKHFKVISDSLPPS